MTHLNLDKNAGYYDVGGISTLDIIKAKLTEEQWEGYLLGNTIKYSCRCNFKNAKESDFRKMKKYIGLLQKKKPTLSHPSDADEKVWKDWLKKTGAIA